MTSIGLIGQNGQTDQSNQSDQMQLLDDETVFLKLI